MIQVTPTIAINEGEIQQEFIRASGLGGQNVNKVATAVQLRFDVAKSPSLSDAVRERLISLARKRITEEGVLIIDARRFRAQAANRQDAIERLVELIPQGGARAPNPPKDAADARIKNASVRDQASPRRDQTLAESNARSG